MMLTPREVADIVKDHGEYLAFNHQLIDIFENNLCKYVEADLSQQLSPKSYAQAKHRISPINVLPKIIDKLTNIYQTAVIRQVENGTSNDEETLAYYEKEMRVNFQMNSSNELFNLCNASLIYPCVKNNKPSLMIIENDCFIAYSNDPLDPTTPTHIIVLAGFDQNDKSVKIFWTWSADAFMVSDSNGELRQDEMMRYNNPLGINPIGRLPFVYVNVSKRKIMPKQDTDGIKIVKLIPVVFSDLNLAAMFQCFSILYGINLDEKNIEFAPNAFWRLKSDGTSDAKPEIGSIKPEVDYDQVTGLIMTQLSIWLSTKGIKSNAIAGLDKENFASGFSKMIDEMDTYEARQYQTTIYEYAEGELWDLILNYMHPYWTASGLLKEQRAWSAGAKVKTTFAIQLAMQTRGQIVRDIKEEYAAGFISKKKAIQRINPELTDKQIDEWLKEIADERTVRLDDGSETAENYTDGTEGANEESED